VKGAELHVALDAIHAVMGDTHVSLPPRTEERLQSELLFIIAEALVELVISDDVARF